MAETLEQAGVASADARPDHPREDLADATTLWLAGLPDAVRPVALQERFPHMANTLCRRWHDVRSVRAYLDDLLIDNRGNRQGLPSEVADELATLKNFYETELHPVPQTVWDEVAARARAGR